MIEIDTRLQSADFAGTIPSYRPGMFHKRSDELRAMASQLRNFPTHSGELEIWLHNWARVLERVALEMECIDPYPSDSDVTRRTFGSMID
ncbi:MAG: hypothetical protein R3C97_00380 [Geminicoccaceae bacterium]